MGDFEIHPEPYSFEAIVETAFQDEDTARAMLAALPLHVQSRYRQQFEEFHQGAQEIQTIIVQARSKGQLENLSQYLNNM